MGIENYVKVLNILFDRIQTSASVPKNDLFQVFDGFSLAQWPTFEELQAMNCPNVLQTKKPKT